MRVVVPAFLLALWAGSAVGQDWGNMAVFQRR